MTEGGGNTATKAPPPAPTAATRPSWPLAGLALRETGGSHLPSQRGCAVGRRREHFPRDTLERDNSLSEAREGTGLLFPGRAIQPCYVCQQPLRKDEGQRKEFWGEGGGEKVTDFGSTLQLAGTGFH